eukprot:gene1394-1477_t
MGKNQHSKDRLFITAKEWATQYGGKRRRNSSSEVRPLPYDHCALSLAPFTNPCMLNNNTGVVFDLENITTYLQKHEKDPVTGEPKTEADIIPLHMSKNSDGDWECPVTNKVFTASTHIVIIKTSGNVYSYSAVEELNLKPKFFRDLIDNTPFTKQDIITLQDPQNPDIVAQRDISQFKHLEELRQDVTEQKKTESKLRHSAASDSVMREIAKAKEKEAQSGKVKKTTEQILQGHTDEVPDDVARFYALQPLTEDVNPGQVNTDGKAGMAFTSTVSASWTSNQTRLANFEEIREAKWKIMRKLGKKAYVQLQTNYGNINIELHCDIAPRTCWSFLDLCKKDYYNGTVFHRLVPRFVLQGGDPTGTGAGGESAFGKAFKDEFDTRILHSYRGVLSMANSGPNTNGSQFFITLNEAKHLDLRHPVFGRVVGGAAVLDQIEAIGSDKAETPLSKIELIKAIVVSDPLEEVDQLLEEFIQKNMQDRKSSKVASALPTNSSSSASALPQLQIKDAEHQPKRQRLENSRS